MSFNACESTFWLFSDQFITVSFLNLLLLIALAILFFHHLDITSVVYKLYTTKIKTGSYINPFVIKWLSCPIWTQLYKSYPYWTICIITEQYHFCSSIGLLQVLLGDILYFFKSLLLMALKSALDKYPSSYNCSKNALLFI